MELSIIIVSWNVKKDLNRCLESIYQNQPSNIFEVIVVDNASSDETVEMLKNEFPHVTIIENSDNRGFAAANNQGIQITKGKYIFLLNPDTIVHRQSFDTLMEFMDNNADVGACGPKLLNGDGTIQSSARCFPTFAGALHRHSAFKLFGIFKSDYEKWLMKGFDYSHQTDVAQLMGAALMIRKTVVDKIGLMDERFFMYYEEVDLCYRIKQAGWRVVFIPDAVVTHLAGKSSGQVPVKKQIMAITSLIRFFRKHRGRGITAVFNCVFKPAILLRNMCDTVTNSIIYIFSTITGNQKRRNKAAAKFRNSLQLIGKYGWKLLNI
jgi:GT2 family glycosyltransferase